MYYSIKWNFVSIQQIFSVDDVDAHKKYHFLATGTNIQSSFLRQFCPTTTATATVPSGSSSASVSVTTASIISQASHQSTRPCVPNIFAPPNSNSIDGDGDGDDSNDVDNDLDISHNSDNHENDDMDTAFIDADEPVENQTNQEDLNKDMRDFFFFGSPQFPTYFIYDFVKPWKKLCFLKVFLL